MSLLVDGTTIENIKQNDSKDSETKTDEHSKGHVEIEQTDPKKLPKASVSTVELAVTGSELAAYLEKERELNSDSSDKSEKISEVSEDSPKCTPKKSQVECADQGSVLSQVSGSESIPSGEDKSVENQSDSFLSEDKQQGSNQSSENKKKCNQSTQDSQEEIKLAEDQSNLAENKSETESQTEGF